MENIHPPAPYLGLCLEMSGSLPIDIRIEEGVREADPIPLDILVRYLDSVEVTISQHVGRLKTLYIRRLSLGSFVGRFLTALPFAEAKQLQKVDFLMPCEPAVQVISSLGKAPALQWLRCKWWGELQPLTLFPLQQLTYLELGLSLAWEEIAKLLSQCTSLTTLHLSSHSALNPLALPSSVPLPNLRCFTLNGHCDTYLILPKLHCPSLQAFYFHCENDWMLEHSLRSYDPLFQFLATGNHNLRYLKLEDPNFPMALLNSFFAIRRLNEIYYFDFLSELSSGEEHIHDLPEPDPATIERDLKKLVESSTNPYVRSMVWSIKPQHPGYIKMGWANLDELRAAFLDNASLFHNIVDWAVLKGGSTRLL